MIGDFVDRTLALLELERRAEIEEAQRLRESLSDAELEREGLALLRLGVVDSSTGLGGRLLLELAPTRAIELPAHRFQPGDIAVLAPAGRPGRGATADAGWSGVVARMTRGTITLALDEVPDEEPEGLLRLDRVANDVTFRRLREGTETLRDYGRGPAARLREVLFHLREPRPPSAAARTFDFLDGSLDDSQRAAVAFALESPDVALVHGPPGTGKTTAVVELIRQAVRRRERVLACAPSNIAVDNLAERLAACGVRIVRVGHPARVLPAVVEHSLDALVERSEATTLAVGARRELEALRRKLVKASDRAARRSLRDEVRRLAVELRDLESSALRNVLASAEVVLATCVGAAHEVLRGLEFDLVAVDEAAQALEAACWLPILRGRRAVLAGDHRQLPPTIRSPEAERGGLAVTLFDRLIERLGEGASRMLTVQYRMHELIMRWASEELYGGRLAAHASVRGHLLRDLPGVAATEETGAPLLFIDTAGRGFEEAREERGDSRSNEGEADLVAAHVGALAAAGVPAKEIAVITPYNAQVDLLRRRLATAHPALEIDSVDGFQGREKEAVVISLVRSNDEGDVGFLRDDRRTNVAVTRARRHVALIGDSATVSRHPFLERLVRYFEEHGLYRSAWEYEGR